MSRWCGQRLVLSVAQPLLGFTPASPDFPSGGASPSPRNLLAGEAVEPPATPLGAEGPDDRARPAQRRVVVLHSRSSQAARRNIYPYTHIPG